MRNLFYIGIVSTLFFIKDILSLHDENFTGIKAVLNTKIINFDQIDLSKLVTLPLPVSQEVKVDGKLYKVVLSNIFLEKIYSQKGVKSEVINTKDSLSLLKFTAESIDIDTKLDVKVTSLKYIHDEMKDFKATVVIKEVELSLKLEGLKVTVVDLKYKIKDIVLRTKASKLLNLAFKAIDEVIRLDINNSQKKMEKKLQDALDKNIPKKHEVDIKQIGSKLDLSLTNGLELLKKKKSDSFEFLEDDTSSLDYFLEIGLNGLFKCDSKLRSIESENVIENALNEMEFLPETWTRDGALLISDSSINSLLNSIQSQGKANLTLTNEMLDKTGQALPFGLDTYGMRVLIPEFEHDYSYENKKNTTLNFHVSNNTNTPNYIKLSSSEEGIFIKILFNLQISVVKSDKEVEVVYGSTNLLVLNVFTSVEDDNIVLNVFKATVNSVDQYLNKLGTEVNVNRFKTNLTNLINAIIMSQDSNFKINPNTILAKSDKLKNLVLSNYDIAQLKGYNSILFDAKFK